MKRMKNKYCHDCPLVNSTLVHGTIVVNWRKTFPDPIDIMIVGRDPGRKEVEIGEPFVGQSGQLLRKTLKDLKLKRYYLTNACKCRPPENKTNWEAGVKCLKFLTMEIEIINPSRVITLGKDVLAWTSEIAKPYWKNVAHPAYIVRQRQYYDIWKNDLRRAIEV